MATIREVIKKTAEQLGAAGIENNAQESELLLGFVLNHDRTWLFRHADQTIGHSDQRVLTELIKKRTSQHQPLAYIVGHQPFRDLDLTVTPDVLIPRPETEYLVELVAQKIRSNHLQANHLLDIGTGSGAIAISFKKMFPDATVSASDVSPTALAIAKQNAVSHNTVINFFTSDLLINIPAQKFALIVANLPYVPETDWPTLQPEVTNWEPKNAITAGPDGLLYIGRLIEQVPKYLTDGGWLALEIDPRQGETIRQLVLANWPEATIEIEKDLAGRERFVFICYQ